MPVCVSACVCVCVFASFYFLSPHQSPVVRSGEGRHDDVAAVDVEDVGYGLQDVEVEVGVAGDGAVEAGLKEIGRAHV